MAYKDPLPFAEITQAVDSGRLEFIQEAYVKALLMVMAEKSPFVAALNKGEEFNTLAPEFEIQKGFPRELTATLTDSGGGVGTLLFSGYYGDKAISLDRLKQSVKYDTYLWKRVSGVTCYIRVTSATISGLTVDVAAAGNTSLIADSEATTWHIESTPWKDTRAFGQPTSVEREKDKTYTQQFMIELQITETEKSYGGDRTVKDTYANNLRANTENTALEIAGSLINSRPVWSAGLGRYLTAYDNVASKLAGLLWWAEKAQTDKPDLDIYVNLGNQAWSYEILKAACHALRLNTWADFHNKNADWQIWTHPNTKQEADWFESGYRQSDMQRARVGFGNEVLNIEGVDLPLKTDMLFPEDVVMVLPMGLTSYGRFAGGGRKIKNVPTDFFADQIMIREVLYGLMPKNPRWMVTLYNARKYGT